MKKFFQKIFAFIGGLFSSMSKPLKNALTVGARITDAIKNFDTKNPFVADVITNLIPGNLDDKIKQNLREALPKIVIQLRLVEATTNLKDPNAIVLSAIKTLQQIKSDWNVRGELLDSLATLLAEVAADGKLDWNDAATVMKYFYDNEYKK